MRLTVAMYIVLCSLGCGSTDAGAPDAGQSTEADVPVTADVVAEDTTSADAADIADFEDVEDTADVAVAVDVPEDDVVDATHDVSADVPDDALPDVEPDVAPDIEPELPEEDTADTAEVVAGCTLHSDCLDVDFCTKDLCTKEGAQAAACTHVAALCDDADPCTTDSCDPLVGCVNAFVAGDGCAAATTLFEARFDDGTTSGLVVEDVAKNLTAGEPAVVWVPDPSLTFSGAGALYFGIPGKYDYDNGKMVAASAKTTQIALPAGKQAAVTFQTWLDVEPGKTWDVLTVSVVTTSGLVPVWGKNKSNVVMNAWQAVTVDLSAFAGTEVQIALSFNSVEGTYNSGLGVVIDSLRVLGYASSKTCAVALDCSDGIACTNDVCTAGACEYTVADSCCVNAADCFDGDACTIDVCQSDSTCGNIPVAEPDCCNTDAECEDNNACTADTCQGFNNRCDNKVLVGTPGCCATKSQCNDNDKCTIDDCKNFMCINDNTCCKSDAECDNSDPVCTDVTCVGGACKKSYKPIPGCCTPTLFEDDFESGLEGWVIQADNPNCKWQVVGSGQSKSPPSALWYGNVQTKNYDCQTSSGSATSPAIDVPDKPGLSLELDMWFSIEGSTSYDKLNIAVKEVGGGSSNAWTKSGSESQMTWFHHKLSLDAFQGKTIQVVINFDTSDSIANTTEGVYVDNVMVTDPCN